MSSRNKLLKDFDLHCEQIAQATSISISESSAEKEHRINSLLNNYGKFFEYYLPHYATNQDTGELIGCSKFQIKFANLVLKHKILDIILNWFRSAAKSTHAIIGVPLFLWTQKELRTMVVVGENADKAKILLSDLQAEFESNERLKNDFGEQYNMGDWQDGQFILRDGAAFFALGAGQSPRGLRNRQNRPDYIVVSDIDTKKRCKNPTLVREVGEWCIEDLRGCFGTWRQRYVHDNNRINKTSVLSYIQKQLSKAYYMVVKAVDANGNPTWKERDSKEFWDNKFSSTPYRSAQREYMNNPIEEGTVFKDDWIRWTKIPALKQFEKIVAYCDPSFKGTKKNDFKAIKVWGKKGKDLFLIKSFVRQCSISEMVKWFYELHESLPEGVIIDYVMEANFMQDMILDDFEDEGIYRGYQLPIRGDKRKKPDKFQRIEALSPLYEKGLVYYNVKLKEDKDMTTAVDQLLAFEKGSGAADDSPDADEGAIYELQKYGRERNAINNGNIIITKRRKRDW